MTTAVELVPLPPILSRRGPVPRTLVFGSVGDYGHAVASWFGDVATGSSREYEIAIVYYGDHPDGRWANSLRQFADHFETRSGGKFQNLLWWIDRNPGVLDRFDYVVVADDDIALTPEVIGRIVRTTREYRLPVASPSHSPDGRVSWPHMASRGVGRRADEPTAGVELCNFVEMTCPILEVTALRRFLDLYRPHADRLVGWGADWIISNACYDDERPFGVLHNVRITNPHQRQGRNGRFREIDRLQPMALRRQIWQEVATEAGFPLSHGRHIRAWLPQPRMRCINLDRATERRERFTMEWNVGLGFDVRFFSAWDRRDVEEGRLVFPYDEAATRRRINRPMSHGEIACSTSHALVMREELEFCGPEGVVIMEDDCFALPGAERIAQRIRDAVTALPGIEAIACHKPHVRYTIREEAGGAMRMLNPPWGSIVTWYNPAGLQRAYDMTRTMDGPADWIWREFSAIGKFAMLNPPLAWHEVSDTTYIGNEFRGVKRRFMK